MDAREAEEWLKQHGVPPPTPEEVDMAFASCYVQVQAQILLAINAAKDLLAFIIPEPELEGTEIQKAVDDSQFGHKIIEEELRKTISLLFKASLKATDCWSTDDPVDLAERDQVRQGIINRRKEILGS